MTRINENFLKLRTGYLFAEIGRRVKEFKAKHPESKVISLGIGDVTEPLPAAVTDALQKAVRGMGTDAGFRGYGPEQGYPFLIDKIIENDFNARGVELQADEIFVSDGAKCDCANIQEIFDLHNTIALADPVYPVYVDTNVMAGRTGDSGEDGRYEKIVYMPCIEKNQFVPDIPAQRADIIYLCFPNNPTGATAGREQLSRWVEYARQNDAVILFDAAYEAFITDPDIPHSIYEIDSAKQVAIEFRSFSKTAGFTGLRCAYTVVPKQLKGRTSGGKEVSFNKLWHRRHGTKFNGASYLSQVAAAATYSVDGKAQYKKIIDTYMSNAKLIHDCVTELGYRAYGGNNAPYIWMKTPNGTDSWEFFEHLLRSIQVIGTPGSGFGAAGEGYLRFSAFAKPKDVSEAMERFRKIK